MVFSAREACETLVDWQHSNVTLDQCIRNHSKQLRAAYECYGENPKTEEDYQKCMNKFDQEYAVKVPGSNHRYMLASELHADCYYENPKDSNGFYECYFDSMTTSKKKKKSKKRKKPGKKSFAATKLQNSIILNETPNPPYVQKPPPRNVYVAKNSSDNTRMIYVVLIAALLVLVMIADKHR